MSVIKCTVTKNNSEELEKDFVDIESEIISIVTNSPAESWVLFIVSGAAPLPGITVTYEIYVLILFKDV